MEMTSRFEVVTPPTSEPVTILEAKKQLEIASSDTAHDEHILLNIQAAREQWEHDTDSALMTQTLKMTFCDFEGDEINLARRPIQSVTHVKYYDTGGTLTTLSSSVYGLDKASREVRLAYLQQWPTVQDRWDGVAVTYVAGYASRSLVPAIAKQAILLLVGYYFDANRGDNDRPNDMRAYESLVLRFMRSTYP
jgi:uncharacterized phiE125 gp8 family phage protein